MIANDLKVALLPMEIVWGDKDANLGKLEKLLLKIHPQTDLVVLPETFSTGFPSGGGRCDVEPLAEKSSGETMSRLHSLSRRFNMAIAGSFIAEENGVFFNRAFFIEPSGDEYFSDKRHLFTMAGENDIFSPGSTRMKLRYRGWNIAMIVCYDLRFPVWCRNVDNEYDLLIAVANWPAVRAGAWEKLLFARAIENQAYVCGVDCSGVDKKGFEYDGRSAAVDFKGNDISIRLDNGEVIYATLHREKLDSFRDRFQAWRDSDRFELI